jgi:hypothetical protein
MEMVDLENVNVDPSEYSFKLPQSAMGCVNLQTELKEDINFCKRKISALKERHDKSVAKLQAVEERIESFGETGKEEVEQQINQQIADLEALKAKFNL